MDYLVHVAYVLYLVSYSVRDMLWLRALTVLASVTLLPYYYYQPKPMMAPMIWLSLFTLINALQIVWLLLDRRPVVMTEDEDLLYRLVFRVLKPREFFKLLALGRWESADAGDRLVEQGHVLDRLILIYAGRGVVEVDGEQVAELKRGQFIGEMGFVTDEATSAGVTATEPTKYYAWPTEKLRQHLQKRTELQAAMQLILGRDLVRKLKS